MAIRFGAGSWSSISKALFLCLGALCLVRETQAQQRSYIGYVYPAGGQQGTTFNVRVGGQNIDDTQSVMVTGKGVSARIAHNYRRLNNQEMQLLNEQLSVLKRATMSKESRALVEEQSPAMMMMADGSSNSQKPNDNREASGHNSGSIRDRIKRIENRTFEFVANPACASIASIMVLEVTVAADAEAGEHELRLVTGRGISNPLPFHVGETPETSKKPMRTASKQILGKEAQALRRRGAEDATETIALPCTVNGQLGSSEVNRYTFQARKGQKLVINTLARQLIPFIADAVPGWFQPVLALYDAAGNEVAYNDDFNFKPDPVLFYEVPLDGEYSFTIRDSLYRGREDFVYRVTIGEIPFITSIHPLGRPANAQFQPGVTGWNLDGMTIEERELTPHGTRTLVAKNKSGLTSNRVPFAVDSLPEAEEEEPNDTPGKPQAINLPCIINGRIARKDDWDVYHVRGKSNQVLVAEVEARQLDSPLDSILKVLDSQGRVLALNDDSEDLGAGIHTHHADSYVIVALPADGDYYVHIGDTARQGGESFSYRLRISEPEPGFDLRVVPSSLALRSKGNTSLTVYATRKDGFEGPIKLALKDPPKGFSTPGAVIAPTQTVARLTIRTDLASTPKAVTLQIAGTARAGNRTIEANAVASEDQMQAFLWRHLVPATELKASVFDPSAQPRPRRLARMLAAKPVQTASDTIAQPRTNTASSTNLQSGTNTTALSTNAVPNRPRFTKQQVAGRLRQLGMLFDEGMLTDEFYAEKVAECEAVE